MRIFLSAMTVALVAVAPSSSAIANAAPASPSRVVHIRDDAFVPATLSVRAGETVTFVNDDDDAHTATSDSPGWDSEGLPQGGRWSHRFTIVGKTPYHCTVHPMMHGTIVVVRAR